MLVCARLRHMAGTQWGNKKYMGMKHLEAAFEDTPIAGELHSCQGLQIFWRKTLDTTKFGKRVISWGKFYELQEANYRMFVSDYKILFEIAINGDLRIQSGELYQAD